MQKCFKTHEGSEKHCDFEQIWKDEETFKNVCDESAMSKINQIINKHFHRSCKTLNFCVAKI